VCLLTYEGMVEWYSRKYIKANLWRIKRRHEFEDAMQESFLVYTRVSEKYGETAVNEAHFMSLYKASLHNWLINEVKKCMRSTNNSCMSDLSDSVLDIDRLIDSSANVNLGEIERKFSRASSELQRVLRILFESPDEFLELSKRMWLNAGHKKAFGKCHMRSQFGVTIDVEKAVRRLLHEKNVRVRLDID